MSFEKIALEHIPMAEQKILRDHSALDNIMGRDLEYLNKMNSIMINNIQIMKKDQNRLKFESNELDRKIKENKDKLKINKQLPYLVSDVVEILDFDPVKGYSNTDQKMTQDDEKLQKCAVVKTTSRQTVFLPVIGTVSHEVMDPGERVGVNKDSFLVLEKLPMEFDSRVKAFEIDERPTENYDDVGGLDSQIEELYEAVVLPIISPERFEKIGITPPKGVLMHGPPGTGKTLLARACAAKTNAAFLKIAAPQLVQMYTGDGARIVRDVFKLAAEKGNCIIFIDEIDAIGTKRFDSDQSGEREVQRTMLELLNQLDGFSVNEKIKVIACTNRPDVLDPALVRSGRLDRKIEFPLPDENSRKRILIIHSKKMSVNQDVNYDELARSTVDFNGAQLKAVCVEAGMVALRRDAAELTHEDFVEGITQVLQKKKANLDYYA